MAPNSVYDLNSLIKPAGNNNVMAQLLDQLQSFHNSLS